MSLQRIQKELRLLVPLLFYFFLAMPLNAQTIIQRIDSILTYRYYKANIDTNYITRPKTKWTIKTRLNLSGTKIEAEGTDNNTHFMSKMKADYKMTLSLGVSYLGFSLNLSLNPAKLMGKYHDYELNFNSYGKRFGFDIIYQDAKNFTGWHESDGKQRIELPADILNVKTLNVNAYYAFNSRHFSYPAAFSQSYIQRRSAGSFMLALSCQGQNGTLSGDQKLEYKMTNIGIGGGYGYNYVPAQGWLLHLSALPTFIVYSNTSMTFNDTEVPLHYHFPEVIITGRGAIVRQMRKSFFGLSMIFNFTNVGNKEDLTIHNIRWHLRTFYGFRF